MKRKPPAGNRQARRIATAGNELGTRLVVLHGEVLDAARQAITTHHLEPSAVLTEMANGYRRMANQLDNDARDARQGKRW
jgi:hypothetical protein